MYRYHALVLHHLLTTSRPPITSARLHRHANEMEWNVSTLSFSLVTVLVLCGCLLLWSLWFVLLAMIRIFSSPLPDPQPSISPCEGMNRSGVLLKSEKRLGIAGAPWGIPYAWAWGAER